MPLQFVSREKRDELAERLLEIANRMQRSFDQGNDGRISVSDEMIEDIKTAVCCAALAEIARADGEKLIPGINAANVHEETETGPAVGNEFPNSEAQNKARK